MPPRVEFIINSASGNPSATIKDELAEELTLAGLEATVHFAKSGDEVEQLARVVVAGKAEVIVGGGGDGTISTVAAHVDEAGKTLGVLPLGTLNNFSKDLGIPQDLGEAVRVIAARQTTEVDLAEVNGQIFINNSSIGLYPRIVRRREQEQRLGHGKWRAAFWAAMRIFRISPFLKVSIEIDGKIFMRKTPFVFVGNNEYEMDLYNIGRRERLDAGQLSVYFLHRGGRWGIIMLLFHTLTGRVQQWRDFEQVTTQSVTIQTRRKRLPVALDGEVRVLETPLVYNTVPRALKVIVPPAE